MPKIRWPLPWFASSQRLRDAPPSERRRHMGLMNRAVAHARQEREFGYLLMTRKAHGKRTFVSGVTWAAIASAALIGEPSVKQQPPIGYAAFHPHSDETYTNKFDDYGHKARKFFV